MDTAKQPIRSQSEYSEEDNKIKVEFKVFSDTDKKACV